ncbi:MAG: hypothetical protein V1927_05320 [Candidatus Omnitrophota bacterium]
MEKIAVLIITCLFLAGWGIAGYCQDEGESDAGTDSGIEQSESVIGENLDSEIEENQAQAEADIGQMEESMDIGSAAN